MRAIAACLLLALGASFVVAQDCGAEPTGNPFGSLPTNCGIVNTCQSNLCACMGSTTTTATYPTCLAGSTSKCPATQACFTSFFMCLATTTATRTNSSDACSSFGQTLYIAQLAGAAATQFNSTSLSQACGYAVCKLANATGNNNTCGTDLGAGVCSPATLIGTTAAPTTAAPVTTAAVVYDVVVTIRISGSNWSVILKDVKATASATAAIIKDLAKLWGIDEKYVTIQKLAEGSLVVTAGVVQGSGKSPAQLQSTITAAATSSSWLSSLQSVYSTVSTETLTTLGITVTQTAAPTTLAPGQTQAPGSSATSAGVWAVAAMAAVAAMWA